MVTTIGKILGEGDYVHAILYFGLSIVPAGLCYTVAVVFYAFDAKDREPAKGPLHRIGGVFRALSLLLAIGGPFMSRMVADKTLDKPLSPPAATQPAHAPAPAQ